MGKTVWEALGFDFVPSDLSEDKLNALSVKDKAKVVVAIEMGKQEGYKAIVKGLAISILAGNESYEEVPPASIFKLGDLVTALFLMDGKSDFIKKLEKEGVLLEVAGTILQEFAKNS